MSSIEQLKEKLDQIHQWPEVYMFKFILPAEVDKLEQLKAIFPNADQSVKESAKGNFWSFTAREMMVNSETVLERYQVVSAIEGIIAL